jgi:zinc/manganese transport system substrate-binding protein
MRLRIVAAVALLALAPILLAACGDDEDADAAAESGERLGVVATTAQIEALTREVAGDLVNLTGLVPAGADAHDFEPVASDLVAVENADLVLRHGIEFDDWLDDIVGSGSATVVTVTDGITLRAGALDDHHDDDDAHHDDDDDGHHDDDDAHHDDDDDGHHDDDDAHHDDDDDGHHDDDDAHRDDDDDGHHDDDDAHHDDDDDEHHDDDGHGHDHGEFDPHVWHDPDNVKIMVRNIAHALADADPENAAAYEANADAYEAVLDDTKAEIQALIDEIPEENRKLVTNHDAFGYFARAFGLEVVGAVFPSITTEAEPSARETAALLDTIEREGVKAIFAEASVGSGLAETLASDAGVLIVDDLYGDSLGPPGSGADTVHGMLLWNAERISEALR